jgi:hypothetical protein
VAIAGSGARQSNTDRAPRRAEEEGADTLFVGERRRSRRAQRRDPRRARCASEAIKYVQSGTLSAVTVWLESSLISSVASLRGMSKAIVPRTRSPAWSVPVCNMETPAPSTAVSNS